MNDQKEIEWTLRFQSLLDGRMFIADKTMILDEAYCAAGELKTASAKQDARGTEILSTPTTVAIELEDLVPNGDSYDMPDVIRLATRCVDFLKTLSFKNKLRFKVAPAEDPYVHIFDGELLIGTMTPVTFPRERSERARREYAKEWAEKIPVVLIKKAEEGEPDAYQALAMFYGRIYALCTDYGVEYVKWMTRSAEAGDAQNQYFLGCMYACGDVVAEDFSQAFNWYQKAADQDYPDAFWRLGLMVSLGLGTDKDPVKGLELVEKAIDLGAKRAPEVRTLMRRFISTEDVEAAHDNLMRQLENKT